METDEDIYITDNILLRCGKLSSVNDNNKTVNITTKNILIYLDKIGWEELDENWKSLILENMNRKICPYFILECGGDGECLFYCVAEALNNYFQYPENIMDPPHSMKRMRELAINGINDDNYQLILETYKAAHESNELMDSWDPTKIDNINQLKEELTKCWGDHILLQLLQEALEINIIVFNNYIFSNSGNNVSSMGQSIEKYKKSIILYYFDNIHFQLIGKFNGKTMITVFDEIPNEIKILINS